MRVHLRRREDGDDDNADNSNKVARVDWEEWIGKRVK